MDVLTHGHRPSRRWTDTALALSLFVVCAAVPIAAVAATNWGITLAPASKGQARARTVTAPTGVTASCTGLTTPIVVKWNAVANAGSYTVYKSAGGGAYAAAATVVAPTTTWSYSPPGILQTYTFEVSATIGTMWVSGLSTPSATRTVTALLVCS